MLALSAPALASGPEIAPAAPPEPPSWGEATRIWEAVSQAMADFPGEYSVALEDLSTGRRWLYNADRLYHPASTVKIPVALYALEQYRAGKIGWQDLIEYTEADFETPGEGFFAEAAFGELYPVGDLVNHALTHSNNVAVNMLGRHFGWGNIEVWTASIGAGLTHENRLPRASAQSVLEWWIHLHRLAEEDPVNAELLLAPLRAVPYRGRISAGLPQGVPHLHKFGSYNGNYHDSGIVYTDPPYALVVLTEGATLDEADAAIARLSAAVYQTLTEPHWMAPRPFPVVEAHVNQFGISAY